MKPKYIEWINKTQSTNTEMLAKSHILDNLSIIATYEQTAGRGQGDHTWFSGKATNLSFSILYKFGNELPASKAIIVTQITTLALIDYLKDKGVQAKIKWPNDIWVGGEKICGILIENKIVNKHIIESIVGIGFNLNQYSWPSELPNPVSLKELTGETYSLETELSIIQNFIELRYLEGLSKNSQNRLESDFRKLLFTL